MADQQEIAQEKTKKQPQGLFGNMSATQKVLLIIFGMELLQNNLAKFVTKLLPILKNILKQVYIIFFQQ